MSSEKPKSSEPLDRAQLARELVLLGGLLSLVVGIAAYDWRLAAIVAGVLASVGSLAGMTRR